MWHIKQPSKDKSDIEANNMKLVNALGIGKDCLVVAIDPATPGEIVQWWLTLAGGPAVSLGYVP